MTFRWAGAVVASLGFFGGAFARVGFAAISARALSRSLAGARLTAGRALGPRAPAGPIASDAWRRFLVAARLLLFEVSAVARRIVNAITSSSPFGLGRLAVVLALWAAGPIGPLAENAARLTAALLGFGGLARCVTAELVLAVFEFVRVELTFALSLALFHCSLWVAADGTRLERRELGELAHVGRFWAARWAVRSVWVGGTWLALVGALGRAIVAAVLTVARTKAWLFFEHASSAARALTVSNAIRTLTLSRSYLSAGHAAGGKATVIGGTVAEGTPFSPSTDTGWRVSVSCGNG